MQSPCHPVGMVCRRERDLQGPGLHEYQKIHTPHCYKGPDGRKHQKKLQGDLEASPGPQVRDSACLLRTSAAHTYGPVLWYSSDHESANQDLQNRLLNLESANLMQELQSINNKCIAKIGFVDNKYEYLMDRTLTLQSEVVTTQTLCKEKRLSLTNKIRSLESCVSEEHNRWYDSMKNLESQAREKVHSLEQTLCARLQALEETLCKHDKEPNKQKGKTIKVITSPNGSNPMAYPVIVHERPADDTHPEPYVTHTLQPISIRDFKNMKEAIVTYGIHSTYVKQMLNSQSTSNRIIQDDWHQLTSAVLEYSQQLQWKSWLREEARSLEQQGKLRGFEIS
ncbi:hypothetical protein STEG23_038365 [Scotinomys teguina]